VYHENFGPSVPSHGPKYPASFRRVDVNPRDMGVPLYGNIMM
jgi:hypothetical protein